MHVGQTIRTAQTDWDEERIARGNRAQVYAVATAAQMGRDDLSAVRLAAALEDDRDPVVWLSRWFDAATYPPPARFSVDEALAALETLDLDPAVVEAFRAVQPLIQPVGLE